MESTATEVPARDDAETALHWIVFCPERQKLANVEIGARAAPFATFCCPRLTVNDCSFWPETEECARVCLHSEVEPQT